METIEIKLPDYLAKKLPQEESVIQRVLELGLKQLEIEKAVERYKEGGISLAKAAEIAGISIREMIPIAYAHGLEPKYDHSIIEYPITPEISKKPNSQSTI